MRAARLAFEIVQALVVDDHDIGEAVHRFRQLRHLVFNLCHTAFVVPLHARDGFHGLRKRLVPAGELVDAFFEGHL